MAAFTPTNMNRCYHLELQIIIHRLEFIKSCSCYCIKRVYFLNLTEQKKQLAFQFQYAVRVDYVSTDHAVGLVATYNFSQLRPHDYDRSRLNYTVPETLPFF